jgi:hypothetical protein
MLIKQQYAMMDSIGVERRILRKGDDAWQISEADTTCWAGISFAIIKFSSMNPDSTVRRTLALTTEFAPDVCPEQGGTGGGRGDEPQAEAQAGRKSDHWLEDPLSGQFASILVARLQGSQRGPSQR